MTVLIVVSQFSLQVKYQGDQVKHFVIARNIVVIIIVIINNLSSTSISYFPFISFRRSKLSDVFPGILKKSKEVLTQSSSKVIKELFIGP